ncbi:MAG: TetR/AcrR family transcriptional regulator [Deltaproteobacteria bacterium]|nr:TetR/AcrR family transcriptional regulator [Deltaproteobacteria bacterium]
MIKRNTEDAIIEAARALFARFGFKRTAVEQIAKQAQVSKATLYSYYSSKEALFAEVVRREAKSMFAEVSLAVEKAPPEDRIRTLIETHYQALIARINPGDTTAAVLGEILPLAFQAAEDLVAQGLELTESLVRQGCEAGIFHCEDPAAAARALQFALRSMDMTFVAMAEDRACFHQGYQELLDLLIAGLQHNPSPPTTLEAGANR